jgi:hypothetical protein
MHIKQHANLILETGIEHPLNLLGSSIHTADIRVILIDGPVANRKTDSLNSFIRKLFNVLFSVPGIPMCCHPLVGVVRITLFFASLGHNFAETM